MKQLKKIIELINKEIEQIDFSTLGQFYDIDEILLGQTKSLCLSGKRLRGSLLYYAFLLNSVTLQDEIPVIFATYLELVHTYLLVVDDFMDKSDTRRELYTIHKVAQDFLNRTLTDKYSERFEHVAHSIGVSYGLIINHLSSKYLFEKINLLETQRDVLIYINQILAETGYGQSIDMFLSVSPNFTEDDILKIHEFKTAKYTFEMPIIAGLKLSGNSGLISSMREYSYYAGIAFQIKDDLIGVFGQEEDTGKSNTSDILEGKRTLLFSRALEKAASSDKEFLLRVVGSESATLEEIERVREIFVSSGSREYSEIYCANFLSKAREILDRIEGKVQNKDSFMFFRDILEYIQTRKK